MVADFTHEPVMVDEIVEFFAPVPPGLLVDATVGGGHHSAAVLASHPGLSVLGLDQDPVAVAAATEKLAPFGDRAQVRRRRFDGLGDEVRALGHDDLSGFFFDLGVSSPQIDQPHRGFSYRNDGPLDMRMDPDHPISADRVVNSYDVDELADVLRWYGDVPAPRRVASAIVAARPIEGTQQLGEVVRAAVPARERRRGGDPAKRVFQAVRIEVNAELDILPDALDQALGLLGERGRGAVLAYHSGEDRIVKDRFRQVAEPDHDPRLPRPETDYQLVWRGSHKPSAQEQHRNPRSASARLRGIERRAA
ncbi:MAG: 16S rRNA (cytosine(1402)-N(4))-methyltransferase RsmH [Acidimicrobiia bacterium]|nr:16S rRNA (cytosine(1402)-N(4))-methyltransferase RsmH [Acidimicrobiia bacterium]